MFLEFFGIFIRVALTLDLNWGSFSFSLVYREDVFSVKYMLKCFTELRPYVICMSIHTIKVSVLEKTIFLLVCKCCWLKSPKRKRMVGRHSHRLNITLCDKWTEYVCTLIQGKNFNSVCILNLSESDSAGTKKSGVILLASSHPFAGEGSILNVTGIWSCVEKPENGR